jgi:plastocyanin
MRHAIRGAAVAIAIGALLLPACSTSTTNEQTTGTPADASVAAATGPRADIMDIDAPIVEYPGVEHLHFAYGPVDVLPGQNNIELSGLKVPKPDVDGYIVGIRPNLRRPDGSIPGVDVIHLHHGVWLNASAKDATAQLPERLFATGEEKTVITMPEGYGYAYKASDRWLINYMIHNLLPEPDQVSMTYDIDFIPATAPEAAAIKAVRPIWMDVENGKSYPVFDAIKGSGHDGEFTYPRDADDPYHGARTNTWTVDRDSVIVGTGGHLHPGGLHDDLYLTRAGASAAPGSAAEGSVEGDTAHLFESEAQYWEPAGAVSWDVAMTVTPEDWRVQVRKGDVLSVQTTYDVSNASWYESMGIMNLWLADGEGGADPFVDRVDVEGVVTHGHLPENDNHGGTDAVIGPDPTTLPSGQAATDVNILDFVYGPGDMANYQTVPTVKAGQPLTFTNLDDKVTKNGLWHTITSCKAPCNRSTGIAYPLADADVQFDSGELGTGGVPTADRITWQTPTDLSPGTYTYFCRIHPFMRGSFRVTP